MSENGTGASRWRSLLRMILADFGDAAAGVVGFIPAPAGRREAAQPHDDRAAPAAAQWFPPDALLRGLTVAVIRETRAPERGVRLVSIDGVERTAPGRTKSY